MSSTVIVQDNHLYRVRIAAPFPVRFTNAYLGRQEIGRDVRWHIMDPGFYGDGTVKAWDAAFEELAIPDHAVVAIYVTHFHVDHLGAAGWLQKRTQAPVYVLDQEIKVAEAALAGRVYGGIEKSFLHRWYRALGVRIGHPVLGEGPAGGSTYFQYSPVRLSSLQAGSRVPFGMEEAEVLWAPGHTNGQGVFYLPSHRELLSGDHILPKITPNVSRVPFGLLNPLEEYMSHLEQLLVRPIGCIWPAHGDPILDGPQRIREIYDHHIARAAQVRDLLGGTDRSAFDVCTDIFSRRHLSDVEWYLAIGETLAHLEYLVSWGQVERLVDGHRTLPSARIEQFLIDDTAHTPPRIRYARTS